MTTANVAFLVDPLKGFAKNNISTREGGCLPVPGGEEIGEPIARLIEHVERSDKPWFVVLAQDWHPKGHISFASSHKNLATNLDVYSTIYLHENGAHNRPIAAVQSGITFDIEADHRGHITRVRYDRPHVAIPSDAVQQILWPDHCIQGTRSAQVLEPIREVLPPTLTAQLEYPPYNSRNILRATGRQGHPYAVIRKGYDPLHDSYSLVKDNGGITETPARAYFEEMGKAMQVKGINKVNAHFGGLATDFCVDWSYEDTRAILPGILKKYGVEEVSFYFLPEISRGISPENSQAVIARMATEGVEQRTIEDIIRGSISKRPLITHPTIAPSA